MCVYHLDGAQYKVASLDRDVYKIIIDCEAGEIIGLIVSIRLSVCLLVLLPIDLKNYP